jgi:ribosomal protein S10
MNTFTARVELHSANPTDYSNLYTEMQKESLVAAGPKAEGGNIEFKSKDKSSINEVIDAVVRAASKTGKKFSFTVMKDKNLEKLESRVRYHLQHS